MKTKAVFYHAGCPVCVDAEKNLAFALDPQRYDVEIVHLGNDKSKLQQAEKAGLQSVPALHVDDHVYHINFGAALADLR